MISLLRSKITATIGPAAYKHGWLNRAVLVEKIFRHRLRPAQFAFFAGWAFKSASLCFNFSCSREWFGYWLSGFV